ncbi:glycosyltransferase family 2 protein [Amycolatopsis sp. NPDC059090]|uniref:glycosyltransferase family 2 protein n=1 Tax=unclassified Amycolatopsis TaxID=2618356 RepID=UPI00367161E6
MDADLEYYAETPLVEPVLQGIADATISNLDWRPIYPDQWLNGFFVPLAGLVLPKILPKVGSTPWSGQRAARRELWPQVLPAGFTSDLAITLHWNQHASRLRSVLADDWFNPLRPKPELLAQDFQLLVEHAIDRGRIPAEVKPNLAVWFSLVEAMIDGYDESNPDPMGYERNLLEMSIREVRRQVTGAMQ